jgi:hypothetical protein
MIALLQKSQCLADNLAGRLVQAALDLLIHESFELWRKRNVHQSVLELRLNAVAGIVNI